MATKSVTLDEARRRRCAKSSARSKATHRRRFLICTAILVALSPLIAWLAAHLLIVRAEIPSADAIVVFSGAGTYIERATWAAKLFREGRAPVVVITNDGLISGWDGQRNPYFYELISTRLQQQGVPAERIELASGAASGAYEESLLLRDHATSHQYQRVLIVTSAYHSRRALWSMHHACEGSGIQVGIETPPPGWQTPSPWLWWSRRFGWKTVAGEYAKMIYYWSHY